MSFHYRYRKQILIFLFCLILVGGGVISYFSFFNEKDSKPKEKIVLQKKKETTKKNKKQELEENIAKEIMVDVKGFVVNPGIYKLKEESRVIDAINAAGGVLEGADTSVLNLSKKLKDEMVIIVYSSYQVENFKKVKEEEQQIQDGCINGVNEVENDACIEENGEEKESNLVSINTATLEELMTLEGIGEAKAKSIIAYREEHGPYQAIEDLLNVSGIGESLLAKIKENITL
ncbi:MAG: helix-hairpin-helix domain-containing protein [bacterium]|nr:helix-hairpin-helix domain-containing protein [bacterium]